MHVSCCRFCTERDTIVPAVYASRFLACVVVFVAVTAYGGQYQRTRDGKTLVWNNRPLPGDAASWSGDRDDEGYATGYGTLIWYTRTRPVVTGSTIPRDTYTETTRYSGTMEHGKFEGAVVNVDPTGRTFHGTFADGKKTKDWAAGHGDVDAEKPSKAVAKRREAPAEGPLVETEPARESETAAPATSAPAPASPPPVVATVANAGSSQPSAPEQQPPPADDSLRALIAPPSNLRVSNQTETPREQAMPPTTSAVNSSQLSATEVIHLAETEAQLHGYDLREFHRSAPQYNPAEDLWTVSFDQRSATGTAGKHFRISVEDKTQKALIAGEH